MVLAMKAGKPSLVRAPSSDAVVCYGTVFVAQSDNDWVNVDKPAPVDRPQFGSANLDASFVSDCLKILVGMKWQPNGDWNDALKQVASTDHRASTAVHIYACSVPFRDVLATLTEEQEDHVAHEWYRLLRARREKALQKMRGPRFNSTAVKRPSQKRQVDRSSTRATLVNRAVGVPFVASYRKGIERLVFVGAHDAFQPNSPTMKAVKAGFQPKIVILEGFPPAMGENPPSLVAEVRRYGTADADEYARSEGTYAGSIAPLYATASFRCASTSSTTPPEMASKPK
jgi:hypothetical protein